MLGGAVFGAELTLHHHSAAALFTACALVAATTITPRLSTSRTAAWRLPT
jgi:hypothetical protein